MKKQTNNIIFPGQKLGTVTVYIKPINKELNLQLEFDLFNDLEDSTQRNS